MIRSCTLGCFSERTKEGIDLYSTDMVTRQVQVGPNMDQQASLQAAQTKELGDALAILSKPTKCPSTYNATAKGMTLQVTVCCRYRAYSASHMPGKLKHI